MRWLLGVLLVFWSPPVFPLALDTGGLEPVGTTKIINIIDGDTVSITPPLMDSTQIRLVGIQAPKLALGRKGFKAWPLAKEARDALGHLIGGETVQVFVGTAPQDRHGRLLAHLVRKDGLWVQGTMLREGWARTYSFRDNRLKVPEMLAIEAEARNHRRGLWAHPNYAIRMPEETDSLINRFELVEGTVLETATIRGRTYLNFGANWRDDFTILVRRPAFRLFDKHGMDLLSLKGQRVRVRGWLERWNGPLIEVDHPEQLELLTE